MQHPGLYSWPKRFRYLGIIITLIASLFWIKQFSSQIEYFEVQQTNFETRNRIIEREILILDIAHESGDFFQWYLGWEDRDATLNYYSSVLENTSDQSEQTEELRLNIKHRLAGDWPENPNTAYLTSIFISAAFFNISVISAFILFIPFCINRRQPTDSPPLPWFSVGWVLMTFFLADLFSNYFTKELYQILYEHNLYAISIYILTDGISRAIVPFLICCLSFTRWKHFRKKFFPTFKVHWKLLFFASGCTYITCYLLGFILPESDQISYLDPINPDSEYLVYILISSVIFAPIFEEITFRGLLFQGTRHKLGFFPAAIFSSILFASIHLQYDWMTMISVGIGGFAGCWVTYKTGSLATGIIMHALHNLSCFVSFYFYYQQPL